MYDGMDVVQERDVNNVVKASVTRDGNIGGILARSTPGLDTVQPIDQTGGMMAQAADQAPVRAKARLRQINWGGSNGARMAAAPMAAGNQSSMATAQATTGTDTAMATRGGTTTYFGYDPQGNVTTLTDSSGAVVGSYNYDAWGNLLASSGTRAADNPYRFATKETLDGMSYFGYRFYNAGTGRWINRDPLREDGGVNLYMGMANDPVNKADEYGLYGDSYEDAHDPAAEEHRREAENSHLHDHDGEMIGRGGGEGGEGGEGGWSSTSLPGRMGRWWRGLFGNSSGGSSGASRGNGGLPKRGRVQYERSRMRYGALNPPRRPRTRLPNGNYPVPARRVTLPTKNDARDAAQRRGGGNTPILDPDQGHGPHWHPGDGQGGRHPLYGHDHYYWIKK